MIQPRSGLWSILVMLVAVSMIVTACQASTGGTTPSAAAAVDPNGAFNTNMGSEPDTIDPQKESFVGEVGQTMMVFEALMALDPKTLKPIPGAARGRAQGLGRRADLHVHAP